MVLDLEVANHAGVLSFYGADKLHVNGFSDDFRLRRLFGSLMEPPVTMMSGFEFQQWLDPKLEKRRSEFSQVESYDFIYVGLVLVRLNLIGINKPYPVHALGAVHGLGDGSKEARIQAFVRKFMRDSTALVPVVYRGSVFSDPVEWNPDQGRGGCSSSSGHDPVKSLIAFLNGELSIYVEAQVKHDDPTEGVIDTLQLFNNFEDYQQLDLLTGVMQSFQSDAVITLW